MTDKRFILSDFFWEVLDTKYDWFGNTKHFNEEVIEEEDYLLIGRAKTQEDGEDICKLLNKLIEENEQLQKSLSASVEKNRKLQRILDKLGYEYIGDLK